MRDDNPFIFNRLLDYYPQERLSRMDGRERAALLQEILGKGPSEEGWQALVELFAGWTDGESRDKQLEVAERALESWPDRLRSVTSAKRYLYQGDGLSPLARLVRSIEIYRREEEGSAELWAIASSRYAERFRYLSIVRSEIASRTWQAFLGSPYLAELHHLHVGGTVLGSENVRRLFDSRQFRRLRCLKLIDVGMRPRDLERIQQSLPFPELCALDVSSNALGDEGVDVLSQSPWLRQIKHLTMQESFVAAKSIRGLLSSPFVEGVEEIDLSGNAVTVAERAELTSLAAQKNVRLLLA